jgi:pimeloyl-ACP methyl ester carboxylesterase
MRQTFGEAVYSMLHELPDEEQRDTYDKFVYESGRAATEIGYWLFDPKRASKIDEAEVTCPTLVIACTNDRATPVSVVKKVAAKYKAVSVYEEFPDRGHWVLGGPRWQEIAEYVRDWLDRVST